MGFCRSASCDCREPALPKPRRYPSLELGTQVLKRSNISKDDFKKEAKDTDSMLREKVETPKDEATFCNELLSTLFVLDVVRFRKIHRVVLVANAYRTFCTSCTGLVVSDAFAKLEFHRKTQLSVGALNR